MPGKQFRLSQLGQVQLVVTNVAGESGDGLDGEISLPAARRCSKKVVLPLTCGLPQALGYFLTSMLKHIPGDFIELGVSWDHAEPPQGHVIHSRNQRESFRFLTGLG